MAENLTRTELLSGNKVGIHRVDDPLIVYKKN